MSGATAPPPPPDGVRVLERPDGGDEDRHGSSGTSEIHRMLIARSLLR